MSRREEVTKALIELMQEQITEVADWKGAVIGAKRGQQITGTVSCDRISFAFDAKGEREATATYSIYVLDPTSVTGVDAIADHIVTALSANPSINRWATDSRVKEIIFGVAQGREASGLALITVEVKFDLIPTFYEEE
jgi:hypothetical protein